MGEVESKEFASLAFVVEVVHELWALVQNVV